MHALRVASLDLHLHLPEGLEAQARAYFRGFAPPRGEGPAARITLSDDHLSCSLDGEAARRYRLDRPALAGPALASLVLRLLERLEPAAAFLHANALLLPGGQVLALLGDSGAGKTTLSRLAAQALPGARRLAEDVLIIAPRPGGPVVIPYPRAAGLRDEPPGGALPWWGPPTASPRWMEPPGHDPLDAPPDPVPLRDARVCLLAPSPVPPRPVEPHTPRRHRILCTHVPPAAVEELAAAGLDSRVDSSRALGPVLDVGPLDSPGQLAAIQRAVERHGGLVLFSAPARPAPSGATRARPPRPSLAPLPPSEGLARLLAHQFAFDPDRRQPPGAALMHLARLLPRARFEQLVPGGTPADTLALWLHDHPAAPVEGPA